MSGDGLKDCMVRLGKVLMGKVEPSVDEVMQMARAVQVLAHDPSTSALHRIYDEVVLEPEPHEMAAMLAELDKINGGPKSYQPTAKGGSNGGRSRAD